ncbi:glycosyl hydrolase family 65 protein [Actinomycetospora lemnae]|uniref:Glycosyl hydrolase family 65 protein n=1 Tax=Actinomycetospora lemnae TaxID=3019891 RepID=A0ABT5STH1_9PSEU|nr:glycosyl hydrolase family 65 protein [Actinomycetospora sp. DW7H6]MDD7966149.1 glycosyl hydrolase family 65 protein [Actinomycetospora sp. DW7H6]
MDQTEINAGSTGDGARVVLEEAVRRLDATPRRVAVIAADPALVRAGRDGGARLVVGIERTGRRAALEAAGADVVLTDVSQLDLGVLRCDPWTLAYEGFDPAHEGHREALTTLGNGYLGTRGAAPESHDDGVHYPGTYLAGVYNRLTSTVQGRKVEDEHIVNVPNWLVLDLRIGDGPWWSEGGLTAAAERRELDLRRGVLEREVQLTDTAGRGLRLAQRRLVSMHRPHLAALETTVAPQGWSGVLGVRSGIDAGVVNANVTEYAGLADRHLTEVTARRPDPGVLVVQALTGQSRIAVATAARTVVTDATHTWSVPDDTDGRFADRIDVDVVAGRSARIDKTVAVVSSRDRAISTPVQGALDELARAPVDVAGLLAAHEAAWARLWSRFHVRLHADRDAQLVLHLHLFHLLQAVGPHSADLDSGVPARGLHGEGYRGHVFWDELFVLPVMTMHMPEVSAALIEYRWRRLGAARQAAAQEGLTGALFPWQSGSDGREETPAQLFNVRSRRWMPDHSSRQRHVGLAVAYNAWQYFGSTGDTAWLARRGAELIVEVARLFSGLAEYDPDDGRFHIAGVAGPDEYHDGYPGAPGAGVRDNAYTNVLAAWVCRRAGDALLALAGHDCDELVDRLGIRADEQTRWAQLGRRLAVPFHADGVISQFDGYEALAELEWDRYRATYGNIGRLDLILEAEGDSTNRYKLAKQADVLMLVYLLGPAQLIDLLRDMGHSVTPDTVPRTVRYYLQRTAHGSTLSRVVHASVLAHTDTTRAWAMFRDALVADLDDTQGGTTREGIHLGAMAGTIDIVTRSFAGLRLRDSALTFDPRLPVDLHHVDFEVRHRGQRIAVSLDHERLLLESCPCAAAPPVTVTVAGRDMTLEEGHTLEVALPRTGSGDLLGTPLVSPATSPDDSDR